MPRTLVHPRPRSGVVDTRYLLAYADAVRRKPGFDVRLPQYLLQDERPSYPPLFPMLLALLPSAWLRRWFWVISPGIDCTHLLFLYFVCYRITASTAMASLAAAAYAFTPQLVSDTRSLSARPFGALLCSLALLLSFRCVVSADPWPWLPLAVLTGSALFLSSAAMAAAFGFVSAVLSLAFRDAGYLVIALAAIAGAVVLSGGHFFRVVRNYGHAGAYGRRNHHLFGGHVIQDSPVYGRPRQRSLPQRPGFLGESTAHQLLRLFGENPFLRALPLTPYGIIPWGPRLYAWALALAGLAIVVTVLPPLRAFGPGRTYMRAAVFPTAYVLAFGIGTPDGLKRPLGLATLACLTLSVAAIAFFYRYTRSRPTEMTARGPGELQAAAEALRRAPEDGVLMLPFMYADSVAYASGKKVLWGGHCGDLRPLERITPVLREPDPGAAGILRRALRAARRDLRDRGRPAPPRRPAGMAGRKLRAAFGYEWHARKLTRGHELVALSVKCKAPWRSSIGFALRACRGSSWLVCPT